jgi:hypothetical protein
MVSSTYQQPGNFEVHVTPEYEDEVGLGGFHLESCELDGLLHPDEVIAPFDDIEVVVDYSLSKPVRLGFRSPGGFTCRELVRLVSATYRALDDAAGAPQPFLLAALKGPADDSAACRLVGHDLSDLILEAFVHQGAGVYRVEVGS